MVLLVARLQSLQAMFGKGKQFVPHGARVLLEFPGGAGYGKPSERSPEKLIRDLQGGYVTPEDLEQSYGLSREQINAMERSILDSEQ